MKTYHLDNDNLRLYFHSYNNRSDDDEFEEIKTILKRQNCKVVKVIEGPDCDLISCEIESISFDVIRTIDGNGTFIYCKDKKGMSYLEKMFNES